ncbi:MAG: thioredoxin family protein [Nocardioidaceae bacterium]|nr:thioredoxin family protein [Nocardioidaceae bacterium]
MSTGTWVLIAVVVLVLAFGSYRALTDGRFRGTHRVRGAVPGEPDQPAQAPDSVLAGTPWAHQGGSEFTLLQFSSAFCAPCRATRRVLSDVASSSPGIAHLDVDAEHHLDLVRSLGILRTPTTLILDGEGRELGRASGTPTKANVLGVLGRG